MDKARLLIAKPQQHSHEGFSGELEEDVCSMCVETVLLLLISQEAPRLGVPGQVRAPPGGRHIQAEACFPIYHSLKLCFNRNLI